MIYGSNPETVISRIQRRIELRRKDVAAVDGRKLALIIEGGGMRSVYSGAGAAALEQLGMCDVFDEVYATSASVMSACYFITKTSLLGMSVYFENCPTWSFFNPARFWKVLNVDYIVDQIAANDKPINSELLTNSRTHLLVSVCNKQTGEVFLADTRTTKTPLLQVMRGAMAIPVFYNRTVNIDGYPCIDSGTVLPFPLIQAFDRNCTDILVLLTRPASFQERAPTRLNQRIFDLVHSRGNKRLSRAFAHRNEQSQLVRDLAIGRVAHTTGVNIAAICPDESFSIENTTTNQEVTYPAAMQYGKMTMKLFGGDAEQFRLWRSSKPLRE